MVFPRDDPEATDMEVWSRGYEEGSCDRAFLKFHEKILVNKDGASTIAEIDNAELANVLQVETKEGMTTLPVDEPNGKDSGGALAMEVDGVPLETKFPAKFLSSDLPKPPKSEVTNRLKPVKRPE